MGDGPFVCYREFSPPTSVVGAEYFQCYNQYSQRYEPFLATISSTVLNIYRVQLDIGSQTAVSNDLFQSTVMKDEGRAHLALVKYEKMFGKAKEIRAYHRGQQQHDLLIIAIDEGKIIAIEYIPEENRFNESIICNVEENAFGVGADIRPTSSGKNIHFGTGIDSIIRTSNEFQMLCVSVYGEELLFASFDSNVSATWQATNIVHHQLLCNLRNDLKLSGPILDVCFLHGTSQPTIAILQEESFLPIGHAKAVRNTCSLTAVAVDLSLKAVSVLWKKCGLPHDSLSIMELPAKAFSNCVGVVSQNAFMVIGEQFAHALAMNGFASVTVDKKSIQLSPWTGSTKGVELDGSFWSTSNPRKSKRPNELSIVGILRSGMVIAVQLRVASNTQISNLVIEAKRIGQTVRPSCCCSLDALGVNESPGCNNLSLLFVGSRNGQSILYLAVQSSKTNEIPTDGSLFEGYMFIDMKGLRKRKLEKYDHSLNDEDELESIEMAEKKMRDEELEIYGACGVSLGQPSFTPFSRTIELFQMDHIDVIGPLLHGFTTKPDELFSQVSNVTWDRLSADSSMKTMQSVSSYIVDKESKESLIVASGLDDCSSLNRIFSGVGLGKVGSRNFPGATRMFTSTVDTYCLLLVSYESKTKVLQCKENVLHTQSFASQHSPDLRFVEMPPDDSGFIVTSATLGLDVIYKSNPDDPDVDPFSVIVQVVPIGVRLIKVNSGFGSENEPMQDMLLSDSVDIGGLGGKLGETICSADFLPTGYVVIVTNLQNMYIIKYVSDDGTLEIVYYQESKRSIAGNKKNKTKNLIENNPFEFLQYDVVSASFYKGELEFASESYMNKASSFATEKVLTELEKEELAMYGMVLSDPVADVINQDECQVHENGVENSGNDAINENVNSEKQILIVSDTKSNIYFIDIETAKCIWESRSVDPETNSLKYASHQNYIDEKKEELSNRYIIETRLARLTYTTETMGIISKLVLFTSFHTGELLVFNAFEVFDPKLGKYLVTGFSKFLSRTIQNKRYTVNTTTTAVSSSSGNHSLGLGAKESGVSFAVTNTPGTPATTGVTGSSNGKRKSLEPTFVELDPESYLLSEDYVQRGSILTVMKQVHSFFGSDIVLIGSSDPLVFALPCGHGAFYPLDFPETPYVNAGNFIIRPFYTNTFSFLASMWYEFEDLDSLKNPQHMKNRAQKQSTLSLYRVLPRQVLSPYGTMTRQPISVKQTVHKCQEILKLTDDSTEQALLEKKTLLLLCSSDKCVPFSPHVVSGEESILENELVVRSERYFADVESFAQPDTTYAPAPDRVRKEYKICLVQNGKVVDSFPVKENEQILDMTVAYFNVERQVTGPSHRNAASSPAERRIFVVVSTLQTDERGEDTQGKGRILLLSLDYAMFGNDDDNQNNTKGEMDNSGDGRDEHQDSLAVKEEVKAEAMEAKEDVEMDTADNHEDKVLNKSEVEESARKRVQFGDLGPIDDQDSVAKKISAKIADSKKPTSSVALTQQQFLGSIQPKLRLLSETAGPASVVMQIPNSGIKESSSSNQPSQQVSPWTNYMVTTIGSTLFIHKFNSTTFELNQLAFFFAQVSSMILRVN